MEKVYGKIDELISLTTPENMRIHWDSIKEEVIVSVSKEHESSQNVLKIIELIKHFLLSSGLINNNGLLKNLDKDDNLCKILDNDMAFNVNKNEFEFKKQVIFTLFNREPHLTFMLRRRNTIKNMVRERRWVTDTICDTHITISSNKYYVGKDPLKNPSRLHYIWRPNEMPYYAVDNVKYQMNEEHVSVFNLKIINLIRLIYNVSTSVIVPSATKFPDPSKIFISDPVLEPIYILKINSAIYKLKKNKLLDIESTKEIEELTEDIEEFAEK